jgi:outer membrane receptor protein involved in Fe transport
MRSANRPLWHVCAILILLLVLGAVQSWAQLDTGSIVGTIHDKSGAVVSGATVKVSNMKTGRTWEAKSGSVGEYSVQGLPVGPYKVEVAQQGFKTEVVSNVILHPGEAPRADLTLDIGSTGETIVVSAEAATVNTTTSESGATIDSNKVTNLPLNGRDFTSLIALVPGSVTTGGFGQNSLGGYETTFAGVNILLDGTDATRIDVNATSTQLGRQESRISRSSIDSIQEFKVLSGVYSAEYGRSTGDIVNVITKSGSNAVHGTVFEYFRNDVLDAKNYFSAQTTPLRLNQFGGNLGGPLKKDKLFYFINYEGVRQTVDTPTTVPVLTQAARANFVPSMYPVRDAIPLPNLPGPVIFKGVGAGGADVVRNDLAWYQGQLANTLREDTGSVKVDYNASQKDTFTFRYNIADSFTSTQYGVATGQVSPSMSRNHLFKGTWNHTFSGTLLNEAGIAFNRPQTDSLGGGGSFPIFQCSTFWGCNPTNNFETAPGPALFSSRRPQHSLEYIDTVSWAKGRQNIRFGVDIRHNVTHDALDPQYFLSYANVTDFYNNNGIQLDTLGHTMVGVQNTNYGYFVQDDIRLSSRFTVNLGVRYEYNSVLQGSQIGNFDIATLSLMPKGGQLYKPDRNNFAPRVGFSWDPFGTGKTVVRAGGGIFYNPLLTGAALSLAGNYQQSFSVNLLNLLFMVTSCNPPLSISYPVPATLPSCTPPLPASVNSLDQNMRDTYATHWSLGIQQEVAKATILEVNYVGNRGTKLPAGAAYAGLELNYSPFAFFPNQLSDKFGNIRRLGNFLDSNYNALQVSVRRRMANGLNIDANYTWSHEIDDAVNILTAAFQNSHDPKGDYASGDIDVRHNFTIGLVYDFPEAHFLPRALAKGWQASTLTQIRSGLPVNIAVAAPFLGIDELRPNLVAGQSVKPANYSAPYNQLNPAAFVAPPWPTYGNAPRNYGRGPGFAEVDLAVSKTSQITEKIGMQIRGEMFNLANHPNFANPVGYMTDANFGKSLSTIGTHVGTGTSRQAQLALKFIF